MFLPEHLRSFWWRSEAGGQEAGSECVRKYLFLESLMHPTLKDFTPTELGAAIDQHLTESLAVMGRDIPNADFAYGPDGLRALSGLPSPFINYMGGTRFPSEEADRKVEETLARVQKLGVPAFWFVGPTSKPKDLGARLVARGLALAGEIPGMALDLDVLTMPALPPRVEIQEVRDASELETWVATLSEGYEMPIEITRALSHGFLTLGFGAASPMRAFLALQNSRPVACSSVHLAHGFAGIYCVATVPDARRQGIGAAVTAAPLHIARDLGYRVGILHASQLGRPVYQRLGFQEFCKIGLYLSPAPVA
jgi:GNAT superfamily N-acetyltransferase